MNLRKKLMLLFTGLFLFPVFIMFFFGFLQNKQKDLDLGKLKLEVPVRVAKVGIEDTLSKYGSIVYEVSHWDVFQEMDDIGVIQNFINEEIGYFEKVSGIWVYGPGENLLASATAKDALVSVPFNRYNDLGYYYDTLSENIFIKKNILVEGVRKGDLVYSFDFSSEIDGYLSYEGLGETGELIIAKNSDQGWVNFIHRRRFETSGESFPVIEISVNDSLMSESLFEDGYSSGFYEDYRGKEVLAVSSSVKELDLILLAKMDRTEILSGFWNNVYLLVIILAIGFGALVFISLLIIKWIFKPLEKIVRAVEKVSLSESGVLVPNETLSRKDEVGDIARSLRRLQVSLENNEDNMEKILRKRTRRLLLSEQRARKAFESAAVAMFTISIEGAFIEMNDTFVEMFGYTKEELMEGNMRNLIYEKDLELFFRQIADIESGEINDFTMEKRMLHKNGDQIYVKLYVAVVRGEKRKSLYLVCTAVLSQINSERKLIKSYNETQEVTKTLEAVLRNMPQGVIVFKEPESTVAFVNSTAEIILGSKIESGIKLKDIEGLFKLVRDDGSEVDKNELPIYRAINTGKESKMTDLILKTPTKESVLDIASVPIFGRSGDLIGVVAVLRDITDEYNVDKAKTEFVSLASHQLNTPLSAINWYCELLLDDNSEDMNDTQKEYLGLIAKSTTRMVDLVNDLLNVSRLEAGKIGVSPKKISLSKIVNDTVTELSAAYNGREIEVIDTDELCTKEINMDEKLMKIAVENLVSNAIKYSEETDKVIVKIDCSEKIMVEVTDFGYGIPDDDKGEVFGKMFRAENIQGKVTEGNGLGLYLTKMIVEKAGGKISFSSKVDEGTTFRIEFPPEGMAFMEGSKTLA